jgi:hypothetical protein
MVDLVGRQAALTHEVVGHPSAHDEDAGTVPVEGPLSREPHIESLPSDILKAGVLEGIGVVNAAIPEPLDAKILIHVVSAVGRGRRYLGELKERSPYIGVS